MRELERHFGDLLVVIGVHSPKFTAERDAANLRQAVLRYDIRHPVVSDPDHVVWQSYAVSAWPTTVLIDAEGRVAAAHAGEFAAAEFAPAVQMLVDAADASGRLNRAATRWPLEREQEPPRPLLFPGKVLADAASGRLFVADTGHHRLVVATLEGRVEAVIGRGEPGLADGDYATATFRVPQGLALQGEALYVADTGNHAIRRVELAAGRVTRVAGTGEQARRSRRGGPARQTLLRSPWDVALVGGRLMIAMAGSHQLWEFDAAADTVRLLVGTGREALYDDRLERSALAQPSGLAAADAAVYVADSESSAIRRADLAADRMETLVGAGLFEFGDRDGPAPLARLQHPLGVAYHDGMLYVADTYNNKIKRIDLRRLPAVETFLGSGEAGLRDGSAAEARFWEPGGLSVANGRLYIADTNNHALRVADLATGEVTTLTLSGLPG